MPKILKLKNAAPLPRKKATAAKIKRKIQKKDARKTAVLPAIPAILSSVFL